MTVTFYPAEEHLHSRYIKLMSDHTTDLAADVYEVPIFKWLIDNVGSLSTPRRDIYPHGDGWCMSFGFVVDQNYLTFDKRYCVIEITKDIDEKLLTEFALRFA